MQNKCDALIHPRSSWTHVSVSNEALKYQHRRHFKLYASGAYAYASRHNLLQKICTHMDKTPLPERRWDKKSLSEVARKYKTSKEFAKNDCNAYNTAVRRGLLEIVCEHMDEFQNVREKPIKRLSKMSQKEFEAINRSRLAIGASPIKIKIRACIHCKIEFESIGKRSCGCSRGVIATARLSGFDVV